MDHDDEELTSLEYEVYAWILDDHRRRDVIEELADQPQDASHFLDRWDCETVAPVADKLDALERGGPDPEHPGLIEPQSQREGRFTIYRLTDRGRTIADRL